MTNPREVRAMPGDLRAFVEAFARTAEAAVAAHENRNAGGMRVPFTGDFANVPPSVVGTLRRWARDARDALAAPSSPAPELVRHGYPLDEYHATVVVPICDAALGAPAPRPPADETTAVGEPDAWRCPTCGYVGWSLRPGHFQRCTPKFCAKSDRREPVGAPAPRPEETRTACPTCKGKGRTNRGRNACTTCWGSKVAPSASSQREDGGGREP